MLMPTYYGFFCVLRFKCSAMETVIQHWRGWSRRLTVSQWAKAIHCEFPRATWKGPVRVRQTGRDRKRVKHSF